MPPLNKSIMVEAAKARFRSFNLQLPTIVSTGQPANLAQFLVQNRLNVGVPAAAGPAALAGSVISRPGLSAAPPAPRPTATPQSLPPAFFRAASNDKVDVDFQQECSTEIDQFISKICDAIVASHLDWKLKAYISGIQINAVFATGGCIKGPSVSALLPLYAPQSGLWGCASAYSKAVGDGLSGNWQIWMESVRVPGLPWYPIFAAYPGPQTVPTPNIPSPLIAMIFNAGILSPQSLGDAMRRKLNFSGPYCDEIFQSVGTGIAAALALWFPSQMVQLVMGKGYCPTFAPPYVPVAPVAAGTNIEAPGNLAS